MKSIDNIATGGNLGLHRGKMGACICYFKYFRQTGEKSLRQKAKKILIQIAEDIGQIDDYSFMDGLMGIGWGIELISQFNYLKVNTNEVLEDLDDEIYKLILYNKSENISLEKGTLGKILYTYRRIKSIGGKSDFYRDTVLLECLMLSIDELYEYLIDNRNSPLKKRLVEQDSENLAQLSQCLIMLMKLYPMNFNYVVEEMLLRIMSSTEELFDDLTSVEGTDIKKFLMPINAFNQAGHIFRNNNWKNTFNSFLTKNNCITDISLFNLESRKQFSSSRNTIISELQRASLNDGDFSWQEGWLLR